VPYQIKLKQIHAGERILIESQIQCQWLNAASMIDDKWKSLRAILDGEMYQLRCIRSHQPFVSQREPSLFARKRTRH
jgi:hypothetical protein